jgi:hypothetical protein
MKFPRFSFLQAGGLFYYLLSFFFAYIAIISIIYYSNSLAKQITIKDKTMYAPGKYRTNMIIDSNGNAYTVTNDFLIMHYTSIELYGSMEIGKSYSVLTYGLRLPFLGVFPNIVKATPV